MKGVTSGCPFRPPFAPQVFAPHQHGILAQQNRNEQTPRQTRCAILEARRLDCSANQRMCGAEARYVGADRESPRFLVNGGFILLNPVHTLRLAPGDARDSLFRREGFLIVRTARGEKGVSPRCLIAGDEGLAGIFEGDSPKEDCPGFPFTSHDRSHALRPPLATRGAVFPAARLTGRA